MINSDQVQRSRANKAISLFRPGTGISAGTLVLQFKPVKVGIWSEMYPKFQMIDLPTRWNKKFQPERPQNNMGFKTLVTTMGGEFESLTFSLETQKEASEVTKVFAIIRWLQ